MEIINCEQLKYILSISSPSDNILLCGAHGSGKTEILTEYFSSLGMEVVPLYLSQMSEPGDLIGLPFKNEKTGHTDFMPPYWFPTNDTPIVLFLDELNRAHSQILQTIMDLALNRKLAGRALPAGSRIISAVNIGSEYTVTDLDPALASRFNIYMFKPSVQEWVSWAQNQKFDNRIIDFILERPEYLDGDDINSDNTLEPHPNRRAWFRVNKILKKAEEFSENLFVAIAGIIGRPVTNLFVQFVTSHYDDKELSAKKILFNFPLYSNTIENSPQNKVGILVNEVFKFLEVTTIKETEISMIASNIDKFSTLIINSFHESAGLFLSNLSSRFYPNANNFIFSHCELTIQACERLFEEWKITERKNLK